MLRVFGSLRLSGKRRQLSICEEDDMSVQVTVGAQALHLVVQLNKVGKQKNSLCNGGESYEAIVNTAKVENGGDSRPVL